jgi:Fe-Mn family superoxide dismutase
MKVTVKHIDSGLSSEDKKMYNDFIKFINSKYPVGNPLTILFLGKKNGAMSTGSQNMNGELRVLSRNRLNRDIMRTLAHEWVHAHQRLVLGRERGPDIGGQNEDEANAFAGRLIKMFETDYPHYNGLVFESTTKLMKNVQLLNEQILLTEKEEIKNNFLLEMKKIGIEKLPYSYSAMKQFVDPETMDIHYNKHYKGYVKKLNDALSKKNYKDLELEDIIKSISKFDEKVRNNAGGAFNHALFWKMLSPKKQRPSGEVYEKIKKQYGNIKNLKDEFNQVALDRFGSGWAWLILTKNNKLKIMSTPNQDNPLMNIIKDGGYPLLGLDVWEHAYYLRYRNKRDEYVKNFWNHINWEFVNELYLLKNKKFVKESYIRVLLENEETGQDIKKLMSRELQKIRLIPLDAEAAESAISNIITAEIERGSLNFNRKIEGLMTLDLSNVSERSKFRFENYFQRFVKSRTRGYDFEALIAGLLGGQLAVSLNSPYDVFTPNGDKISCKIIRNTKEKINLKSIKKSVNSYIINYNGSPENKEELIRMSQFPNFLELILRHKNQDIRNCAEDILNKLLEEVTGMLVGIPSGSENKINLYYFDRNKLIQLAKIPEMLMAAKTKGSQTITFSSKILEYKPTMTGQIKFPILSQDEYVSFLSNTPETTKIVDLMNFFGEKYGVSRLGDNIPQDVIRSLSKNERFKLDLSRIVGLK